MTQLAAPYARLRDGSVSPSALGILVVPWVLQPP